MKKLSEELEFFERQTNRNCREWIDEAKRLESFESSLSELVDRLGHDAGSVCDWGRLVPSAQKWADAVYEAAEYNRKREREDTLFLMQKALEQMEQVQGSGAHSANPSNTSNDVRG